MSNMPTEWPQATEFKPYDEVKDEVSGFKGKLTGEYKYANGCIRYEVSGADKEGKPQAFIFDIEQLTLVKRAVTRPAPARTGGSRSTTPVAR
jgi:hypothetical protein